MNAPTRRFVANNAVRERVPLLIGLMGPSGGGKTFSALRLATGIQRVTGGEIYVIDTEAKRALHYADRFKFKHVPFTEPFGSRDYLEAMRFCVSQGAKTIVVDSMSHEHEGPGGMLDLHEQVLTRMAGNDYQKRERMKMLAWAEPKAARRELINGILRLEANFIFCFRAKNTSKPVKNAEGKTEVVPLGFMPIAGEEFVFEQTLNALLLPGAGGVPSWSSQNVGESTMIKLPEQFAALRGRNRPLDENLGAHLARWASGESPPEQDIGRGTEERADTVTSDNPTAAEGRGEEDLGEAHSGPDEQHPAVRAAEQIKRAFGTAGNVIDLANLKAARSADIEAMPDEMRADVEAAYAEAERKLKGPK